MSTTTDITTLKINYLTQAQYNAALAQGLINENELYLTPSESKPAASGGIDLSLVTTGEKYTWNQKQDALVSGTNIKTINNTSILGSGNIDIQGGGGISDVTVDGTSVVTGDVAVISLSGKQDALVSGTNIKTINNQSILGSGNITITSGVSGVKGDSESAYRTGNVNLTAANIGAQAILVSGTNIKTINNTSLLGAGDISVGTVTSIATGAGLTGGPVISSGTIKANLVSETSQGTIGITNKLYAVGVDSTGALCASVPWTDTTYTAGTGISIDSNNIISVNLPNAEGGEF